jgi:hypothetical protein
MSERASLLQWLLVSPGAAYRDQLQVELLDKFHATRQAASHLRACSDRRTENAAQARIWIASELGGKRKRCR